MVPVLLGLERKHRFSLWKRVKFKYENGTVKLQDFREMPWSTFKEAESAGILLIACLVRDLQLVAAIFSHGKVFPKPVPLTFPFIPFFLIPAIPFTSGQFISTASTSA